MGRGRPLRAAGTRSRSSVVERFLGKEEVTGSIPVASSMGKEVQAGPAWRAGLAGAERARRAPIV